MKLIESQYREKLTEMELHTVDELFQRIEKPEGHKELVEKMGISDDQISDWLKWSQLIRLKGLGIENFLLLEKLGIDDVKTLARQEPFKLYEELVRLNKHHRITSQPLDVAKVKVWIRAAKKTEGLPWE